MSKPVFILLHGAWHSPKCWNPLIEQLDKAGYKAVAPALPSTGSTPPTPGLSQDIEVIQKTVSELVPEHDVVVVMHSFAGMAGGTALQGLDKKSCTAKSLKCGVSRIIYVASFMVPEGFQHSPVGTRDNMVEEMITHPETGTVTVRPEDAKAMFYQDLPDSTVSELVKDLRPHSFAAFWHTTTYAAWRDVPTTYVVCTKDRPSTVVAARYLIEGAKTSGKHRIDSVVDVDAGHSPFLSRTEWMRDMLVEKAGVGV